MQLSDHDLLVEIHSDVKNMSKTVGNHERRIRTLERWMWMGLGVVGFLEVILILIKTNLL